MLEGGTPLAWNWHISTICDHIQSQLVDEKSPQNLLVNIPPGTMKSLIVSVMAPAWLWLFRPSWRMVFASGTPSVVTRDSLKCRTLIKSEWYQSTFKPSWKISADQDEKQHFANTAGGFRQGMGAGGSVVGVRADWLGVDDPNDSKEIHSKAHREAINERWWANAFHNRVADPVKSRRTVIMQRLHEDDLSGHLLTREAGQWAHLCLPMERDTSSAGDRVTWLGWSDPRPEGALLFPERFGPEYLEQERRALGSSGYAGQMQQRPVAASGNRFQREWWRFWSETGTQHPRPLGCTGIPPKRPPKAFDEVIQSWDMTFKEGASSDFVVGLVIGRHGADRYVLAMVRRQMGFTDTVAAVQQLSREWPKATVKLIEDKANGSAVINTLGGKVAGLVAVNPEGGKESRAAAIEPVVEAGNVYLPEGAEWLASWCDEFANFPLGKHDDQVDALSQALIRMQGSRDAVRARMLLGLVK